MSFDPSSFHFLRPEWLWALLPLAVVVILLTRRRDPVRRWSEVIAPHLLEHLVVRPHGGERLRPVHLLALVGVLASVALAGPSWRREPPPFTEDTAPLVIAIDLSESMLVEDIQPSRLARSQQKVRDLLPRRAGAKTALLAYAGSAHMVLPLTDDPTVLDSFVAALDPSIMPEEGKAPAGALALAGRMLADERTPGTVLFLTDGIASSQVAAFVEHEATSRDQVLVLAVATERGGLVPSPDGETRAGVVSTLDREGLDELTRRTSAYVTTVTVDDTDIDRIERRIASNLEAAQAEDVSGRWRDEGYWLLWPIVLLSMMWFRKGWVVRWE